MQEHGQEPAAGDGRHHPRPRLDERRRPRRRRSRSSPPSTPRSATPTSGRTTARVADPPRRASGTTSSPAARFNVDDDRAQIGKPVDRGRWGMTPPTSNAYYNPLAERDRLPGRHPAAAGVQHGRHRRRQLRRHRRGHRPRDQPRLRRPGRAVRRRRAACANWWTDEDLQEVPGAAASAWSTSSRATSSSPASTTTASWCWARAIGDLAGAQDRLPAPTRSRARASRPQPTIDGFTPEQQFFIAWGQFRGDAIRPETAAARWCRATRTPSAKYRVIGPLSNLPEFQQAFSCAADAPMVRPAEKRCEVW